MNILFSDLDGTLEDSRADMTDAVIAVRAQLGLPAWSAEGITPNVNKGMHELYLACFADFIADTTQPGGRSEARLERVREAYEARYLAHVADRTRLYDGIAEALREAARAHRIIVVTNKPERISRALLDALGVGGLITDVMGGDSCPETKPSPVPLRVAAARHGFDPVRDKAYMMGDTLADIRAGKAFGARTLWCAWGYLADPGADVPDVRLAHPSELISALA